MDQAIEEAKKAIEIDMTVAEYHFNLANLYENRGLPDEAIREYKEALKLDSKFFWSATTLGLSIAN